MTDPNERPLQLRFENLHMDVPAVPEWFDALLRITADFEVLTTNGRLYHEEEFCVVELAHQLHQWLMTFHISELEFEYSSLETSDNPMLWFRRGGAAGWKVGAQNQDQPNPGEVTEAELVDAVTGYLSDLDEKLLRALGLRLLPILLDVGRWREPVV